mgnify:CR=1 FL=1
MNDLQQKPQSNIGAVMVSFIQTYWDIKKGNEQIYGSPADIYAERIDDGMKYLMIIDDGNCYNQLKDAVYHIYVSDTDGKIFEGRITSKNEFKIVMKVLGFAPKN